MTNKDPRTAVKQMILALEGVSPEEDGSIKQQFGTAFLEYLRESLDGDAAKDDVGFLLSLVPSWAKNTEPGLDPTFYGTGSHDGDLKIVKRVREIEKRYVDCI